MTGQGELIERIPPEVHLLNRRYDSHDVLSKEGKKALYRNTFLRLLSRFSGVRNIPYMLSNFFDMRKKSKVQFDKLLWKPISDGTEKLKKHFDIAIAYTEGAATYYVAKKVSADIKIAFFHTDYILSGYTRRLDRDSYLWYNKIFCVSDDAKKSFISAYPEHEGKTDVIHNIINPDEIRKKAHEGEGFSDDYMGLRIITLGRLVKVKAFDKSVEAMRIVRDNGIDARWYIFGEGEERSSLEKQIKSANLSDCFFLPGVTKNPYPYMLQSDIYVQCSEFEGEGIAIREAQVLGKPTILSENCGFDITDGVNCLLTKSDPERIADAIIKLAENPDLRRMMGENAAQIPQNHNDIQKLLSLTEG